IDGAAYARFKTYPGICFLIVGYGLALLCISRIARGETFARKHALSALALSLAGIAWAYVFDPLRADGLIRVDVLQCIGASLMLLSAIGARSERRRPGYYIALAASAALITPFVQSIVPGPLPGAVAGYLAQWPNADGARVVSLFPLCPWLGFAAIGVAVGIAWGRAQTPADLELLLLRLMTCGAALALLTNASWAPARWFAAAEPIAALFRLIYKAALCCVMIGPALALTHALKAIRLPLVLLGRSSLLVYWVHLEFAFGTVSRPLARSLSIEGWAYGTAVLTSCMLALAALRNTRHAMTFRAFWRRPVTG
ncbi:MAG TPA: heparan-alpha-glucosaminide N-acetyltransferase domain-containing protein, partial [Polyangiales bacterium]|nr:heparan-alpha-glucosaminide N-acetyltransferase domain-containing protein [Polyangiales bacterium]